MRHEKTRSRRAFLWGGLTARNRTRIAEVEAPCVIHYTTVSYRNQYKPLNSIKPVFVKRPGYPATLYAALPLTFAEAFVTKKPCFFSAAKTFLIVRLISNLRLVGVDVVTSARAKSLPSVQTLSSANNCKLVVTDSVQKSANTQKTVRKKLRIDCTFLHQNCTTVHGAKGKPLYFCTAPHLVSIDQGGAVQRCNPKVHESAKNRRKQKQEKHDLAGSQSATNGVFVVPRNESVKLCKEVI